MMKIGRGVLGAAMMLAHFPAIAQSRHGAEERPATPRAGAEIAIGVFEHGSNFHPLGDALFFDTPPPGVIIDGSEEDGTTDVQIAIRTHPLRWALKPRLTAKLQISTAGRTSFASLGAEWRQHVLRGRVYGQAGIGVTVHDGYRFTPDPFEVAPWSAEFLRRYDLYLTRTSFGSRVLFNPNASIGVRIDRRWATEIAWEHFSHRRIFGDQNPGIDNLGIRLIRTLGRRR